MASTALRRRPRACRGRRHDLVGKPDAGNPHVRFDEQGCGNGAMAEAVASQHAKAGDKQLPTLDLRPPRHPLTLLRTPENAHPRRNQTMPGHHPPGAGKPPEQSRNANPGKTPPISLNKPPSNTVRTLTIQTFVIDLARLAGTHPTKRQPRPRTQKIWEGYIRLQWAIAGAKAIRSANMINP